MTADQDPRAPVPADAPAAAAGAPAAAPVAASTAITTREAIAMRVAVALLGAGSVVWAAAPLVHTALASWALVLAIIGVAAGALRLVVSWVPVPEDNYLLPAPARAVLWLLQVLRSVPWEEGALMAIVWLEVLHPSRPWHTAVLGAALIAYLLAAHLAESDASPRALRPQAWLLAAGAALLAVGAGAGMLPAAAPGAGSALLRLVAAGALIVAAGLVLPHGAPAAALDPAAGTQPEDQGGRGKKGRPRTPRIRPTAPQAQWPVQGSGIDRGPRDR
jgi:hypothetical protein